MMASDASMAVMPGCISPILAGDIEWMLAVPQEPKAACSREAVDLDQHPGLVADATRLSKPRSPPTCRELKAPRVMA